MISLTKAEEQIMHVLWKLEKAFVKEIREEMPEPKPAYNTVSTIIRILEKKEVVGYEAFGKSHRYFPLINKDEYSQQSLSTMVQNYFGGSASDMVSFFVKNENLSTGELEDILSIIEQQKQDKS
jgi:BlaI family penicillinase repressor